MFIPVWLIALIVTPWALAVAFGLAILLGMSALIGISTFGDAMAAALARLLYPFRHVGPWFDYAAAAGVMAAVLGILFLLVH